MVITIFILLLTQASPGPKEPKPAAEVGDLLPVVLMVLNLQPQHMMVTYTSQPTLAPHGQSEPRLIVIIGNPSPVVLTVLNLQPLFMVAIYILLLTQASPGPKEPQPAAEPGIL